MKKTVKQTKKETTATTTAKTVPNHSSKKETHIPCNCTHSEQCDTSCKCGCQEGTGCSCHCGKISKTSAKCITMLVSAALISTSILLVGFNCNRARTAVPGHITDIKIADFIKKNPQVIISSLESYQKLQAKDRQEQDARNQKQNDTQKAALTSETVRSILADKTNYSLGNEKGKFVIVEFFDYRCGWCKRTNTALWEAINSGKAKNIRWVLMDSPIFGEGSAIISRYVLAAGEQGKFKEMHHAVVSSNETVDEAALLGIAKKLSLNIEKLKADAASDKIKEKMQNNQKIAEKLGISGVPYLIVNGKVHGGALLGDDLNKVIEESNK